MMNHSMYGADRLTHLKIVVVALVGATIVAGVGIAARTSSGEPPAATARMQNEGRVAQGYGPVIKAGAPVVMTVRENSAIR
jgi:hypothetical protein